MNTGKKVKNSDSDKQQSVLYSTGYYVQYPVINHNAKEHIHVYMYGLPR